jgi:mannose-6-phosphate isomerase-like protein (cupin superfamily)
VPSPRSKAETRLRVTASPSNDAGTDTAATVPTRQAVATSPGGKTEHSSKTAAPEAGDSGAMRIHDPIAIARNLAPFDFQELAPFNGSAFCMYSGDQGDQADWELHPDTDELLMVLQGSVTVEILTAKDRHLLPLTAGQFTVVPKGHWHRHADAHDVVEMFFTPGTTLESSADDPRVASPETFVPDVTPARSERSSG